MSTTARTMVTVMDEARSRVGLSHERFARSIGVSGSQWSRMRSGKQGVTLPIMQSFLRYYPVSAEDLPLFLVGTGTTSN